MPDDAQKTNGNDEPRSVNANATIPRMPMPKLTDGLHNVQIYFTSLEFWFEASNVTADNRKYCSIMAQIPLNDLGSIQTEIGPVPVNEKYEFIKPIIIAFYSDSQQKRFREAINDVQLGDLKPSQLYQKLRNLASDSLTDTALIDLWAARLPEMAHAAVIQMKDSPVKDRLVAADALVESIRLRTIGDRNIRQTSLQPPIAAEKTTLSATTESSLIESLRSQIAGLERKLNTERSGGRPFNASKSRERSKSRAEHQNCWYHWKFGIEARHCRMPCKFAATNGAKSTNE